MSQEVPEGYDIVNRLQEGRYHTKNFKLAGKQVSEKEFEEKIKQIHRRCANEISVGRKFEVHNDV